MRRILSIEPVLATVGIHAWHKVKRGAVDELGDRRDFAVVLDEIPHGVEHGLARLNLIAVDAAIDVHGWLVGVDAGLRVVQDEREDGEFARTLSKVDVGEERGMCRGERL